MAQTTNQPTMPALSTLFLLFLLPILPHPTIGFRLELIHRDSPRSPLYPGNITAVERLRRLVDLTKARTSSLLLPADATIRPPVSPVSGVYLVLLSIGTPARPYFLELDTTSDLSWIQCAPCNPCFNQSGPIFDPARSNSYVQLPCTDRYCRPPYTCSSSGGRGTCSFGIQHPTIGGSLARETFTLLSNATTLEAIPGVVFGCASSSTGGPLNGEAAGVLGLGRGAESFVRQVSGGNGAKTARFSYCLIDPGLSTYTYLRFGDDIEFQGGVVKSTTPLVQTSPSTSRYYLSLLDISFSSKRFNLPPGTFDLKPDGSGGCLIDTSIPFSSLIRPAYDGVRAAFMDLVSGFGLLKTSGSAFGSELECCYIFPSVLTTEDSPQMVAPTVTLHLQGADLILKWGALVYLDHVRGIFCLAVLPSDKVTVLGAWQQQNTRFEFDALGSQLTFADEVCSKDGNH